MDVAATTRPAVGRVYLWLAALPSALVAIEYLGRRLVAASFSGDFEGTFWEPWHAIRSGVSPYPDPNALYADGNPFLYPPLAAELTLPLSWLPFTAAAAIFTAGLLVSAALTLWALDVREPALWALWMLGAVVVGASAAGNATLVVILLVALTWRWRDRPAWAAGALTAAVVLKLFVWPVVLWLLFTRRYRAAAYTVAATVCLALASWAVIGFDGLADYPALLRAMIEERGANGLLAYALTVKAGSHALAQAVALAVTTALLLCAYLRRDDDRAAITLSLLAALYATPIVWSHYLGLLIIPAALYGGWLWATIPLLWLIRFGPFGVRPSWLIVCFILITAAVAARALVGPEVRTRLARQTRTRWPGTPVSTAKDGLLPRSNFADD